MWNVNPALMCRKHLLGEHAEMHMFFGALRLGKRLEGYICTGLVEVHNIKRRHDELAEEILRRGYKHKSPMSESPFFVRAGVVDIGRSYKELQSRCEDCCRRIQKAC